MAGSPVVFGACVPREEQRIGGCPPFFLRKKGAGVALLLEFQRIKGRTGRTRCVSGIEMEDGARGERGE